LVFLALAGACRPIPLPSVPSVKTDSGRACVQQCQGLYNDCLSASLSASMGPQFVPQAAANRREAINGCRENLGGCYGICPP
jgi:hypothetical protein